VTDLQDFSRRLFAAANQLWTNTALRPDQYAHPVLALIALRQMEAKFEAVHAKLAPHFKGRLRPTPADYQARGAIFLPENARFSRLLSLPGKADLGAELNAAMKGIADQSRSGWRSSAGICRTTERRAAGAAALARAAEDRG
jgi:type I restriction enzyme M protein